MTGRKLVTVSYEMLYYHFIITSYVTANYILYNMLCNYILYNILYCTVSSYAATKRQIYENIKISDNSNFSVFRQLTIIHK